ncbi:putative phage abortive infection protein [Reichenbachiella agariperforans]|uniref:putative phage abortive infection protein n=1 Tax=Reichenbachiella agariperforans TaxID=156994 RepID=UPI001C0842E2|nr:putative phage abortive infection protein [Reichenbachiella agariperforans]MBU2912704.1 putative phage abortive infection protein [Reichenbachiella agariperforans]
MKRLLIIVTIVLIISGVSFSIYVALSDFFNDGSGQLDPSLASNYGGFIGGVVGTVFTVVGFFLLYITLLEQRRTFNIQQFENKYFEFLKMHRENVQNISHRRPDKKVDENVSGQGFFVQLRAQYFKIRKQINDANNPEIDNIMSVSTDVLNDLSFQLLYYGVSEGMRNVTEKIVDSIVGDKIKSQKVIDKIREKKAKYNDDHVFYGGHQSRLGLYFKLFYEVVKFVDRQGFLTSKEKEHYIDMLIAQLSVYEQSIICLEALSNLGFGNNNLGLIRKYHLLNGIPQGFLKYIEDESIRRFRE